jgi:hypothetical protein
LKLTKTSQRNYQLLFNPANLDGNGLTAMLKDNYLGTETPVNLADYTSLNFSVNADPASAASTRFMIVFKPYQVLPVTFTSVKAYQQQKDIAVEWNVSNETNIAGYELEKSTNGNHFNTINNITAISNNGAAAHYNRLDENPAPGNNFYRIKSIELSGRIQYSQIVKVFNGNGKAFISVYPNPLQDNTINLQFSNEPAGKYTIKLSNMNGQLIYTTELMIAGNNTAQAIAVPQQLAKGAYQIEVNGAAGTTVVQQVLVR